MNGNRHIVGSPPQDSRPPPGELTHSQVQIWIGQRLHPESPLYNMAFAWIFQADLRPEIFERAWRRVADASDALRTRVVEHEGKGRPRIGEPGTCRTEILDGPPWADGGDGAFYRWCRERCSRPLDLEDTLVDSVLVPLDEGRTGWYLNLHHLITDAGSTVLLYRRVAAEYEALAAETPSTDGPLEALPAYYPTAASLATGGAASGTAREHWEARRERPEPKMPLYGHDGQARGTASSRRTLELGKERSRALARLADEDGFLSLSPQMSRFALFATLLTSWLHRVGDGAGARSELAFDAPVSGRPTGPSKKAPGLFVEIFPFAVTVEPGETFRSLGARCLAEAGLFLRHALPGTSSPSSAGAGNVVLNYFPDAFGNFAGIPAEVEWVHPGHGDSVHALRLQVHDFGGSGSYTLHFDFNEQALPESLQHRALQHFEKLVDALIDNPDQRITRVDLRTGDELRAHEALHEGASSTPPPECSIVETFLERARAEPGRTALTRGGAGLTFGELEERSAALASRLVREGVERGDRVAILSRRSIRAVVAILAVLRAGAAYVPVDPSYPRRRREQILDDSGARLVLAPSPGEVKAGVPVLPIDAPSPRADLDLESRRPDLSDLAYVLYTSGSTGRPKGVLVEHGGLADYLSWAGRRYVRGERLTFPLFTSLAFDLTVTSLFLPLLTGGTLRVYPEPEGPLDSALLDVLDDNAADFLKLTPSHLSLLRQMDLTDSRVRRVVVGGEDFKTRLAAEIDERLGGRAEIYNEYGPTEAVVGCVAHRYDRETDTGRSVPIGVPADHVRVEILDRSGSPVPQGVPGELWVSRSGLARGYLGRGALTAERFQPCPTRRGERRYGTGDRVRMLPSGELDYLGRLDRQVKIAGHRVESAEIEAALLALPGIEQCAVVPRGRPDFPASRASSGTRHCRRCGLPSSHPRAVLDDRDVCGVCRSYESIAEHARAYFKTLDDLRAIFEGAKSAGEYDCLLLLSGGKDSTYALCRLVEMGLSVYAFTLDNGYISDRAKANIRRVTRQLGVPVELATTPAMNAIFRDSLARFANVCQGCFKTIYTLSVQRARELGIPIIVTGLSRGQMFETRLTEEMFRDGRCRPEDVDAAVLAARKLYHRTDDEVARSLDTSIFQDDRIFEEVRFVDFYRYCDVSVSEMLATLRRQVPWVRPEDTGRSTNCLINDIGIYVHQQQRGYHNYALPYSWDVRMGHKTRDEALAELDDEIDLGHVRRTLQEIGCDADHLMAPGDRPELAAFYVGAEEVSEAELRERLAERLPAALIPTHLRRIDALPLTTQGKLDERALARLELVPRSEAPYRPPEGPVEEFLAELWQKQLGVERVGADDSFFELGGTSLSAMEVMLRLCREYDLDLPLETLFSHTILAKLARVAEDRILEDIATLSDADRNELLAVETPLS